MKKIVRLFRKFLSSGISFGWKYSYRYHILGRMKGTSYKHQVLIELFKKLHAPIIAKYSSKEIESEPIPDEAPIWVCWWQGKEQMPPVVLACYHSLIKYAGNHPIHLITLNNVTDYVNMPDYIFEKHKEGKITLTHLSDILRFSLLAQYGGLWIDATVWVTNKIAITGKTFFTLKMNLPDDGIYVSKYRWTGFCIGGGMNNILFASVRDLLLDYWKKQEALVEYLFLDYFIEIMYESNIYVRKMIDDNPFNNEELYYLHLHLNDPFDKEIYDKICQTTYLHKLTWKGRLYAVNENGIGSFYGHILNMSNEYCI